MEHTVAYVVSRFPHLPETFILREMTELERRGWRVVLYPLIQQRQAVVHREARQWISRARYQPLLSPAVAAANGGALFRHPSSYFNAWASALRENSASPGALVRSLLILPKAVWLAHCARREGVRHVHAHYATYPAFAAWAAHRLTGMSYSLTVHAHDIFVNRAMLATKLREAAFVVAISEYNRDYLERTVGSWVRGKIHVVHTGVDLADYYPRSRPLTAGERFEIICVGSLQLYKGQRFLIEACRLLRRQGVVFRCRIIGEGPERRRLERLIDAAGLANSVQLLGAQPQEAVAELLPTAHCFVQPSIVTAAGKMEGIPVALMEALACRLPVVATRISGVPELVRHGETGYLVPPEDAAALAAALTAVRGDPARAAELAAAGRELVREAFNLRSNVERLACLFDGVTGLR